MTDIVDYKMARYLVDIKNMIRYPWPHVGRDLRTHNIPRGYVYAIMETGSNMIFINWGGRTTLKEIMIRLQRGNPRQLKVLAVLLRDNVHDANAICKLICDGLVMYKVRDNWYDVEHRGVINIFNSIDLLDAKNE